MHIHNITRSTGMSAPEVGMSAPEVATDLSFGVELKFLVPCLSPEEQGPRKSESPPVLRIGEKKTRPDLWAGVHFIVAETIRISAGQQAITRCQIDQRCQEERDYWETHWIVKKANSAEPAAEYSGYNDYTWVPVEVSSPKLGWTDTNSLPTVRKVIRALQERHHIVSNHSCEVHVHVGRRDGKQFSLTTLKRLGSICWLAEPYIRAVKDPKSPNFNHKYTWSSPLRERSRLAIRLEDPLQSKPKHSSSSPICLRPFLDISHSQELEDSKDFRALKEIWMSPSPKDLGMMLSGPERRYRRLGLNFNAYGDDPDGLQQTSKTFECRFLEGVLSNNMVSGWITIICTMVEVALDNQTPDRRFEVAVDRLLGEDRALPRDQGFEEFCRDLQIDESHYEPFITMIRRNGNGTDFGG
ncbi:Uu.00g008700.m01.CDS01 [Anthostomella pinea]|uniref:Uu.00g008700.m01.CDS01 n=1 Tax=Anthostomella pinea TaxID=933095 RepID=A0AAI8VX92_9PEZI|nr:Uu.00g008700.m01.CDS01 [Anthostomella pinea]